MEDSEINAYLSISISNGDKKIEWLDLFKEGKKIYNRYKTMVGLEYTTFNINIVFGFSCTILALFKYSANKAGKIVGTIGIISGVIGFALNLVYVIYSILIFNYEIVEKNYDSLSGEYSNAFIRTKSDGSFKKWNDFKKKIFM